MILRLIVGVTFWVLVSIGVLKASETEPLFAANVEQYLDITEFALAQSRSIVSQTLQDAAIDAASSEEKLMLTDYVSDVRSELQRQPASESNSAARFLQLVSRLLLYDQFEAIVRKCNAERNSPVLRALRRHNLEQFTRELEQRRAKFLADFLGSVRQRTESWSAAEQQKNAKVLDWYEKYKETSDTHLIKEMINEFAKIA